MDFHRNPLLSAWFGKNCLDLWGDRIHHSMHNSSCAPNNVVRDILGRLCRGLRNVGRPFDGSRLGSANGDRHRENNRKERFHST